MSEREREDPREGGSESERAEVRRKEEGREGGRDGEREANCKNPSAKHNNTYNSIMYTDTHRLSL